MSDVNALIKSAFANHQQGKLDQAEAQYRQVLETDPEHTDALYLYGYLMHQRGLQDIAEEYTQRAVALKPQVAMYHSAAAAVYVAKGNIERAVHHFKQASDLDPKSAEALSNYAASLVNASRFEAAVQQFEKLRAQHGEHPPAMANHGNALMRLGRVDDAVAVLKKSLNVDPRNPLTHTNLGMAYMRTGRIDASGHEFREALRLDPRSPDAHVNVAITLLLNGDFEKGWGEYEWRLKREAALRSLVEIPGMKPNCPRWTGDTLNGRTLLVQGEQGHGDALHFVRYLPILASTGAKVILQCHAPLVRLMRNVEGISEVLDFRDPSPKADVHVPILSLPYLLKTRRETIPAIVPYLRPYPTDLEKWRSRLANVKGLKVGISWSGSREHGGDAFRSIPGSKLVGLSGLSDVTFISLQKDRRDEPQGLAPNFLDFTAELSDFADSAALVDCLDLVISCDSAVAHLAGGLGKPTWVMIPVGPDFRWLRDIENSPWYPTMKLFRQTNHKDWDSVIARIRDELSKLRPISAT